MDHAPDMSDSVDTLLSTRLPAVPPLSQSVSQPIAAAAASLASVLEDSSVHTDLSANARGMRVCARCESGHSSVQTDDSPGTVQGSATPGIMLHMLCTRLDVPLAANSGAAVAASTAALKAGYPSGVSGGSANSAPVGINSQPVGRNQAASRSSALTCSTAEASRSAATVDNPSDTARGVNFQSAGSKLSDGRPSEQSKALPSYASVAKQQMQAMRADK